MTLHKLPPFASAVQQARKVNVGTLLDGAADARRWNALVDALVNAAQDRPVTHDVASGFLAIIATYPVEQLTKAVINEAMDTAMVGLDAPDR